MVRGEGLHNRNNLTIGPLGIDFYGAYDAQNCAKDNANELGIFPVPSLNLVFTEEEVRNMKEFYIS